MKIFPVKVCRALSRPALLNAPFCRLCTKGPSGGPWRTQRLAEIIWPLVLIHLVGTQSPLTWPQHQGQKHKKPRCASGCAVRCACLINKTWCFLFLATRCLPGSTDMSLLCLPQCLGRSRRQVKVGGPVISQSDTKLYNSCGVHSRRSLFYEGALMELLFVLLASLLIRSSCS